LRVFDPATRNAPGLCQSLSLQRQRAQETPGARCTRSRAWSVVNTRVSHHRSTGTPGISCAMVLTAYFALSPVTGLSCHRRQRDAKHHRQLDTSVGVSGPHDFAVREISAFVNAPAHVHRIPYPTSVTIAIRPSCEDGTAVDVEVIWVKSEPEYFCEWGWTLICCVARRASFREGRFAFENGRHRLKAMPGKC
jgi:hypothetical protein